jgi:hypothetical protein
MEASPSLVKIFSILNTDAFSPNVSIPAGEGLNTLVADVQTETPEDDCIRLQAFVT